MTPSYPNHCVYYTLCYLQISVSTPFYTTLCVKCRSMYLHSSFLHSVFHYACISVYLDFIILHSLLHVYQCICTLLYYTLCYMQISVSTPFYTTLCITCRSVYMHLTIDLFILKNMGAAIIDFRVCLPLVKCQNLLFSGFIDTLMYGFSSTGVTIYCYFGLKFNDNTCCEVICKRRYNDNNIMTTNKLPGMYFFFNYLYIPHTQSV